MTQMKNYQVITYFFIWFLGFGLYLPHFIDVMSPFRLEVTLRIPKPNFPSLRIRFPSQKWRHFKDLNTLVIKLQTPPLEGPWGFLKLNHQEIVSQLAKQKPSDPFKRFGGDRRVGLLYFSFTYIGRKITATFKGKSEM